MASIEFACPHCRGQFQLENPPAGGMVACPLCHQALTIPTELPPPRTFEGRQGAVEPLPLAFDPGEASAAQGRSRRRKGVPPEDNWIVEPLSRQQNDRRRQLRGVAWMIGGIVLLAIAAAVLSRW